MCFEKFHNDIFIDYRKCSFYLIKNARKYQIDVFIHSDLTSFILYVTEVKHFREDPHTRKHLYKDTTETGFN